MARSLIDERSSNRSRLADRPDAQRMDTRGMLTFTRIVAGRLYRDDMPDERARRMFDAFLRGYSAAYNAHDAYLSLEHPHGRTVEEWWRAGGVVVRDSREALVA